MMLTGAGELVTDVAPVLPQLPGCVGGGAGGVPGQPGLILPIIGETGRQRHRPHKYLHMSTNIRCISHVARQLSSGLPLIGET